jgi:hypothetical protein
LIDVDGPAQASASRTGVTAQLPPARFDFASCLSLTRYLAGLTVYPRASQHCVFTILKQHGRAAIVVPDNDSHLPICSPFGLPVHVGRSRDLHCSLRRRRRRMPARKRNSK